MVKADVLKERDLRERGRTMSKPLLR